MTASAWIATVLFFADLLIRLGLSVRVILRRRPVGVSLAWLFVILLFPFAGALVYLLIGELRLANRRISTIRSLAPISHRWLEELRAAFHVDWSQHGAECAPLARLVENAAGIPALPGNAVQLIGDWQQALERIISDINGAEWAARTSPFRRYPLPLAEPAALTALLENEIAHHREQCGAH